MTDKPFKIAIAGLGTVGAGVAQLLNMNHDHIKQRCGRQVLLNAVSARSKNKDRGFGIEKFQWFDNPLQMVTLDVDLIVELIGGADGVAYDLVKAALQNKKQVVTANKALIATHGEELAEIAESNGVNLMFDAAVAGGVPILHGLRDGVCANKVSSFMALLNGTCNFILTTMAATGRSFEDVLKEAQDKGYAEADPSTDVDGFDTAHKLAILATIGFGIKPDLDHMYVEGIRDIKADDLSNAAVLNRNIKLVGMAKYHKGKVVQYVYPALLPVSHPLADVPGNKSAVLVTGDYVGDLLFLGAGAGQNPTASSVVSDIMYVARGEKSLPFNIPVQNLSDSLPTEILEREGAYYLHIVVAANADIEKGVLPEIETILSEHDISLEELVRAGPAGASGQDLCFTTSSTQEQVFLNLLEKIREIAEVISIRFIRME